MIYNKYFLYESLSDIMLNENKQLFKMGWDSYMFKLIPFLKPYKKQAIIGPIFKLLEAVFEILIPTLMTLIIDRGVKNNDTGYILKIGAVMLGMATLGVMSSFICQYNAAIASQGFGTLLRNTVFEKILSFSYEEIDKFGTSSLTNRITNDINQLQVAVAMLIRLVIRAPFLCIGGVIMAMILDFKLSIIIIVVLPLFAVTLGVIMLKAVPIYKTVQKKLDKLAKVLRESLSGVRVIRAFSNTNYEKKRFSKVNDDLINTAIRVNNISSLTNPITSIITNFAILAIIWFGGVRVNSGHMTQGQVIAYINYINLIITALIVVAGLVVTFTKASVSAARINEILEMDPAIQFKKDETKKKKKTTEAKEDYAVEFNKVYFSYKASNEYALKDISVKIRKGSVVGIIGGTGSGKSTLLNLIPRFYDAVKGNVLINGKNIKDYELETLRNLFGIVPQKAVLFAGTVEENIRWGLENASSEDIKNACETAQAKDFIESLPEKYAINISQGGVNFSGGQKQRLAIARALVRKPEILILDDSFSALDYATDAALRKSLFRSRGKQTILISAQRISTIKHADLIIVMDDGEICGVGTHEELLENSSVYKEIYTSQKQNGGRDSNEK